MECRTNWSQRSTGGKRWKVLPVRRVINRRRSFPSELRGTLAELQSVRHRADYGGAMIARSDAARSLSQSQKFIDAVAERGGWQ